MVTEQDIIYAVTNPKMPGLVKFGIASGGVDGLRTRIRGLHTPGVPGQYELLRAVRVEDARAVENEIKVVFTKHKIQKSEFYEIPAESAISLLKIVELCGGTELRLDESGGSSDAGVPPSYPTSRSPSKDLRVALNGKKYYGTQNQKLIAVIRDIGSERVYQACREGNITHQGHLIVMKTQDVVSSIKERGAWRTIDSEYELNTKTSIEYKLQHLKKIRSVLGLNLTVDIR